MITIEHYQGYVAGQFDMATDDFVYACGMAKPNYPMPAIPTRVEYIFQGFAIDGIFVRVHDYIVAGAYRDGMELIGYPCIPYEFDYPDLD